MTTGRFPAYVAPLKASQFLNQIFRFSLGKAEGDWIKTTTPAHLCLEKRQDYLVLAGIHDFPSFIKTQAQIIPFLERRKDFRS